MSPAFAVALAEGFCAATAPTSMSELKTESPACPTRPTCRRADSAAEGVMPARSGTVTVAAGSLPLEITMLIWVPLGFCRPASGSWSETSPLLDGRVVLLLDRAFREVVGVSDLLQCLFLREVVQVGDAIEDRKSVV